MNELDRVRDAAPQTPFTEQNVAHARESFMHSLKQEGNTMNISPSRRWILPVSLAGGVAAAVTAASLIIASQQPPRPLIGTEPSPTTSSQAPTPTPTTTPTTTTPTPTPTPTAADTAQTVLTKASGAVGAQAGLPDGTWRAVKLTQTHLGGYGPIEWVGDSCGATRDVSTAAWTWVSSYTSYVTTDPTAEWVRTFTNQNSIVNTWGTDGMTRAQECVAKIMYFDELRGIGTLSGEGAGAPGSRAEYYASLPSDGQALLDKLRADYSQQDLGEVSVDYMVANQLITDLQLGAADTPVRAAMFDALGLMGNATLISTDGSLATIQLDYGEGEMETVTFDTTTGDIVSGKVWYGYPAGLVDIATPDIEYEVQVWTVTEIP